jgi:hypothetical protein
MKDYNLKQSLMIVAGGCGLLAVCFYLARPFLTEGASNKVRTTRLEEAELAQAIIHYAMVYQGYPTETNAPLASILVQGNPQKLTFLNLGANSTNKDGQLVDIWNTPYKITYTSTNSFTITSAGENLIIGDADDIIFDSRTNNLATP